MFENNSKILIIDDDEIFQDIMTEVFNQNQIEKALTGEEGLQMAENFQPDLIILDINMPGIDGYETCKRFRENNLFEQTPIIFLSKYTGIDDRLKAYGVGGDDYISKPVDNNELIIKAKQLLDSKKKHEDLTTELKSSYETVLTIQQYAANLQVIGRFLMGNLFCHDLQDLSQLFIKTVKELGISCILNLESEHDSIICSDTGSINRLEEEILSMADQLERIHPFGKNRSLFNWKNVSVLVRNIDDNADIMAILMDGLETGIRAIEKEHILINAVSSLERKNVAIEDNISQQFNEMKLSLTEIFFSLGVSALDPDDEDRLNDCVEGYHGKISGELSVLSTNNAQLSELINQLRSPPEDKQTEEEADPDADSISFF
ncbi:MAG: response regulator [Pseudomonadota bacterium]